MVVEISLKGSIFVIVNADSWSGILDISITHVCARNGPAAMLYVAWSRKESGMDFSRSEEISFSFKNASFAALEDEEDDSSTCNSSRVGNFFENTKT